MFHVLIVNALGCKQIHFYKSTFYSFVDVLFYKWPLFILFFSAVEYIVEYDYDAVHDDELSIHVGDIIKNVKKLDEEGWLHGECNGKRGAFPDNFVKVCDIFILLIGW